MAKELFSYDIVRLTRKERLPDSFVTTEIHPIDGRGSRCMMVTTLEIDSPWHHAREFGQQIVTTLVREFVRSQSNSTLMKFEHALKLTNHTISQAAEKLGVKVSCAVALFIEQEVHFTVIGNCRLLLFRNNALTDVTATDTSQPGQFSSVTSGDLSDHEWLMVANQDVVKFLRSQEPSAWAESDISALSAELIDQAPALERQNFFATLIRYRQDNLGQEQTVFWDNLEHTTPIRLPKLALPKLNLQPVVSAATGLFSTFRARLRPKSQLRKQAEVIPTETSDDNFLPSPSLISRLKLGRFHLPKINKRLAVSLVVIIVVIFSGYRVISGRIQKANQAAPTPTLVQEFSSVSANERINFLATKFNLDRYLDLSADDQAVFGQLAREAGTEFVRPSTVVTKIDKEIVALDAQNAILAAIDNTGQLWTIREGRTIKTEQSLLIQNPRSVAIVNDQRIVVSDATSNLWLFDGSTTAQPIALTQPATLGTGVKLVQAYVGNLYIYAPETKTMFRQSAFDKELAAVKSVGKFDQLSSIVSDTAINGQVIAISDQGQVIGLQAGKSALNGSVSLNIASARIASVEEQPKIAVLSGGFLTTTDKNLGTATKYFLGSKAAPADIAIDGATGSYWIAIGQEIFSVTL